MRFAGPAMARTWATGRAGQEKRGGHRPRDTLRRGGEERTEGRVLERSEKKLNGPKSCTLQIRAEYSAAIPAATGTLPLSPTPPYSSPHSECIHVSVHANTTTHPCHHSHACPHEKQPWKTTYRPSYLPQRSGPLQES